MGNSSYTTSPIAGVAFDVKTTDPLVRVGMVVPLISDTLSLTGKFAMYIRANGIIANSAYVTVDMATVTMLGTSIGVGTSSGFFRNGSVAFADQEYGWVYCTFTAIPHGSVPPLAQLP